MRSAGSNVKWRLHIVALAALCVTLFANAAPSKERYEASDHAEKPRAFGYFIGDVIQRRLRLPREVKWQSLPLPEPERVNAWFTLQSFDGEQDAAGAWWLIARFQIVNSPKQSRQVRLPSLTIPLGGAEPLVFPAMLVTISPLDSGGPEESDRTAVLRPDRPPGFEPTEPVVQKLTLWLKAFGAIVLAWIAWWCWRQWRDRSRLPFDQAWADIRAMPRPNEDPLAWQRLHRAINESAGQVVQANDLHRFIKRSPHFSGLRPALESFFAKSNARFFAASVTDDTFDLAGLSRSLRQIERSVAK